MSSMFHPEFKYDAAPANSGEIHERLIELSARAQAGYKRLCDGAWYYTYAKNLPKYMLELVEARLVTSNVRSPQMHACLVPTGTITVREEFYFPFHEIDPVAADALRDIETQIKFALNELQAFKKSKAALYTAHRVIV